MNLVCKVFLALVWLLILLVSSLHAEEKTIRGLDILALAMINGQMVAEEIDSESAIGFLDSTFGDPYKNLKIVLDSKKVVAVRAHFIDGTCIRNKSCVKGAPTYKSFKELGNRAQKFNQFMLNYPDVKQYASPFLEHDEKDHTVVNQWYSVIKANAPNAVPACSAFTGWCPSNGKKEKHGNSAKADITSNDGASHFDSNSAEYRTSGKDLVLSWVHEDNCRVSGEEKFTSPKQRINCASRAIIRQQVALLRPMTPVPAVKGCSPLKAPEIGKTNAEYYGQGIDDGRGNKLLFIAKVKSALINIQTLAGKTVGKLTYYGTYAGGGYRHYIGSKGGSGQRPMELAKDLGSEWGLLKGAGKCWIFNAYRRTGATRD